jgi:hypothetical protein
MIHQQARLVDSRASLAEFVEALSRDIRDNPKEYQNTDLVSYLAAMAAWIKNMDGYYSNRGEETPMHPTWKTVADIIMAATVYE